MRILLLISLLFLLCSSACTSGDGPFAAQESGETIGFDLAQAWPLTRAHIFENSRGDSILKAEGNFRALAYISGTDTRFFNSRVWYFEEADNQGLNAWRFREEGEEGNTKNYYWPLNDRLDFFAYMPWTMLEEAYTGQRYVTAISLPYAADKQTRIPTFSCNMPTTSSEAESTPTILQGTVEIPNPAYMREFVYAYRSEREGPDPVALKFVHPFAAVNFKLKQSVRMDLKSITFSNIRHTENYSALPDEAGKEMDTTSEVFAYGSWSATGTVTDHRFDIGMNIPNDINFNQYFAGPYLMIPQELGQVKMVIAYRRADGMEYTSDELSIATADVGVWKPGQVYTYTLDLGDPGEEVLYDVSVEAWKTREYKQKIDVE